MQMIATRRKPRRSSRIIDAKYRKFIASLGCVICCDQGRKQTSRTECAHAGERGLSQKCSDYECLPLCAFQHHRLGPESHHVLGKRFWGHHNINKEHTFAALRAVYEISGGTE